MSDAPERIVIDSLRSNIWYVEEDAKWGPLDMTTYIRADLIEELEAENKQLEAVYQRIKEANQKLALDYIAAEDQAAENYEEANRLRKALAHFATDESPDGWIAIAALRGDDDE